MAIDRRRIDDYAARQYGVVTRSQALLVGMTDKAIANRLSSGTWVRLGAGVYAYASAPSHWHRQVSAAVLSEPRAIVGGRSAAHLHGFDGYGAGRPELIVPASGNGRSRIARITRDSHFDQIATQRIAGFSVTTVAETIWSLRSRLDGLAAERLIDSQLVARSLDLEAFDGILERVRSERRPGSARLQALLADRRPDAFQPPTNELERKLYGLLNSPGIPGHKRQCPFLFNEGVDVVVDAYISDWAMIVEADGRRWHTREADFERDRRRDNAALARGLIVVRFTYGMLSRESPYCLGVLLNAGYARATAQR